MAERLLMAFLAYRGARRAPILAVATDAPVVPFHFIPHKEYRFIVVAVPFMVLLLGIAAAEACHRLCVRPASRTSAAIVADG